MHRYTLLQNLLVCYALGATAGGLGRSELE